MLQFLKHCNVLWIQIFYDAIPLLIKRYVNFELFSLSRPAIDMLFELVMVCRFSNKVVYGLVHYISLIG